MRYTITQSRLLYVLSINDRKHQGLLKIGEVFVDNDIADSHNHQEMGKAVCLIREKVVTFRMVKLNMLLSIFLITK